MQRRMTVLVALMGLGIGSLTPPAAAGPATPAAIVTDEFPTKREQSRRALRQEAIANVLTGKVAPTERGASTVAMARGEYVELSQRKTDRVFVILAEFGNERHPDYPDRDTTPDIAGPIRFDGPLHNEIPQPDRSVDNSTAWQPDFSREHFQRLFFGDGDGVESMKTYWEEQSSGRYSVAGTVTDWVKVRYNEARYGRSDGFPCPYWRCDNHQELVKDAADQWFADQLAAGRTRQEIRAELATFDVWDRYDFDRDGEFNEPDGYLDRFAVVHAGGDQSDGDPWQGEDAINSHWSLAFPDADAGPAGNRLGGAQVGDTGLWIGAYTMNAENSGLPLFAHEYGHDLGLPDHYNRATNDDNSVEWWTLMGQHRLSAAGEAIGIRPGDLSAWDKMQMGWLDYEIVSAGADQRIDLGPHEYQTDRPQAVVVVLPDKPKTFNYGTPFAGSKMYWSGKGDNLNNSATTELNLLGKASATLTLKARFDIETGYDYMYLQASADNGRTWHSLDGTIHGQPFGKDRNGLPALSGTTGGNWLDVNVPLTAFAGHKTLLRLQYRTDFAYVPDGFFADEITVTADGAPVFTDGAEATTTSWLLNGFQATTGVETVSFDQFYLASYRTYESYDQYLRTGPYHFGYPDRPGYVDHFAYQDGLLVSYWDTSQPDNDTGTHPGEGQILVVDANPAPIPDTQGGLWRARVSSYDAPFSLQKSDSFTLHAAGRASYIPGKPAQPLFDDTRQYWSSAQPAAGVKLPATGVKIQVLSQQDTSMSVRVFK